MEKQTTQNELKQLCSEKRLKELRKRKEVWAHAEKTRRITFITLTIVILVIFATVLYVYVNESYQQVTTVDPSYSPVNGVVCDQQEQVNMVHYHAHLSIYINGQRVLIPQYTGIAAHCIYWLHTHTSDGVIHIESPIDRQFTVGDFLQIWKKHFPRLGTGYPAQLEQQAAWKAFVNGKPYIGDYRTIPLQRHDLITLRLHSPAIEPDTVFNWNDL